MNESWSINELARMSGVTSRTLRHYDAIGLLEPAWTGAGGRRHYEREQLLRLQEILLLRDLGVGLEAIAEILEAEGRAADGGARVRVEALGEHLAALERERDRHDRLILTVRRTLDELKEGRPMSTETMFDGFEHNPYEQEARERWGDEAVDASKRRLAALTPEERAGIEGTFAEVHRDLAQLRDAGLPVEDERVQAVVARHLEVVSLAWQPSPEAYAGLGRMYVEDGRFRETIGRGDDGFVEYLRDAMAVHAETRM